MKYSYASITKSCTNYGNFFIEEGLRRAFKEKSIQEPSYVFDAFKEDDINDVIKNINDSDGLVIPGCTSLTIRHYRTLKDIIPSIKVPIINTGATFWKKPELDALPYIDRFTKPVGSRDPLAHKFLIQNKIESELIGCPTLFLGNQSDFKINNNKSIIYFYGAEEIESQQKLLIKLNKIYQVKIGIVEEEQKKYAKDINLPIIDFDINNLINEISQSHIVISGRLHGTLPSLMQGIPVIFLSTFDDMRFSLLDYIGIPKIDINRPDLFDLINSNMNHFDLYSKEVYQKIGDLKMKFLNYLNLVQNV